MSARKNPYVLLLILFSLPMLSVAQQQSPVDVALRYMEQHQKELQLTADDIRNFKVNDVYNSKHNQVVHVYLNQTHQGIKVYNAIVNVNILPNGEVLNIGNRYVSDLKGKANQSTAAIRPEEALQKVIKAFKVKTTGLIQLQSKIDDQHFVFKPEGIALEPVKVDLVYQKVNNRSVRLAWNVELYQLDANDWWNARIDAQTGELLAHHNQVIHCTFEKPDANCMDHTHKHPNVNHDLSGMAIATQEASTVDINSYNVFPMPVQSPNHGNRALVSSPATATASPFGWHDTDGAAGPEYTITRGNNVHAYHDIFNYNQSVGDEPDGGFNLDFDYPLNLGTGAPYTQVNPAVTNLFYWNNIIHDVWYQYGFDEAAGNFQVNNYGNGGIEGDYVRAEGLDGLALNNANFGTGADGSGARMQMFIWGNEALPGGYPPLKPNRLVVDSPVELTGTYELVQGFFGGEIPVAGISGNVILVDDGTGTATDACEAILNGDDLNGNIALIDRGNCEFGTKSLEAENKGATAVIICNNLDTDPFPMLPGDDGGDVTIPAFMMSQKLCDSLKVGIITLGGGILPQALPDSLPSIPIPGPNALDGDFDNGIIVHEYGHGISIRLTGGPSTGGCLSNFEQAGEGWSDWFALAMTTTPANTANERRGVGTYAIGQPITGDGIRTFPYTRDMGINPHTYADVPDFSTANGFPLVHGIGSVWCAMIWDLYWNLIDVYNFDEDFYNGTGGNNVAMQLVLDGLKLQPCNPTFIDARDAIIAADIANYNGANVCLIWETFARRGLGFSAQAGGIEAFDTPGACRPVEIIKTASVSEVLSGDKITYTLEITNNESSLIPNAFVTDEFPAGTSFVEGSLSCGGGSVDNGVLTVNVGDLPANTTITCTYELEVDAMPFSFIAFEDDVETGDAAWIVSSGAGAVNWETNTNSFEGDLAWFAADIDVTSDQYLELADPINLEGDNPALIFWHFYDTEETWDGGVVEISTNGGTDWVDLGDNMIQNGYEQVPIEVNPASPISGRPAFHGNSGGYIQTIIDLTDYSNDNIVVRFRFATDGAQGGNGWYIDNIQFYGDLYSITNIACANVNGTISECSEASTTVFEGDFISTSDLEAAVKVAISPNPTDGIFTLELTSPTNSNAMIQILSVDGRQLQVQAFDRSNGLFEFDLSNYQAGVYLLQVQTDQATIVRKVIVQ